MTVIASIGRPRVRPRAPNKAANDTMVIGFVMVWLAAYSLLAVAAGDLLRRPRLRRAFDVVTDQSWSASACASRPARPTWR